LPVPPVGLRHLESVKVDTSLTVPEVSPAFRHFRDMPPVSATAFLVGFVEETCVAALERYLEPGQRTVGTRVDLSHDAATPIGMTVIVEVELIEVDGRRLRFKVEARDDKDVIGKGHYERFVIDQAKFMARLEAKAQGER